MRPLALTLVVGFIVLASWADEPPKPTKTRAQVVKEFEEAIKDLDIIDPKYDEALRKFEADIQALRLLDPLPMKGKIKVKEKVAAVSIADLGLVSNEIKKRTSTVTEKSFSISLTGADNLVTVSGTINGDKFEVVRISARKQKVTATGTKLEDLPKDYQAIVTKMMDALK